MIPARLVSLASAVMLVALLLAAARPALAQDDGRPPAGQSIIDLDFKGGTALDYVEALRRADSAVNIAVTPEIAVVSMEPVQLKRVTIDAAVELLHGMRGRDGTGWVTVSVSVSGRAHGASPVFQVYGHRTGPQGRDANATQIESGVWSLRAIVESGLTAADVLTAIETSLELFGVEHGDAKLRFHAETGLLLARASEQQVRTIHEVLNTLERAAPKLDKAALLKEIEKKAETKLARNVMQVRAEANEETTRWRTRSELLEKEIENIRQQANEIERELRTVLSDRDRLMHELQRCQARLEGGREAGGR